MPTKQQMKNHHQQHKRILYLKILPSLPANAAGYTDNIKSKLNMYTSNGNLKVEINKMIPFLRVSKHEMHTDKYNKTCSTSVNGKVENIF